MNPADRHFEISRSLFREANDAFFLFDPHTQMIVDLNPAALRLTGLEKDAACSMRLDELFSGSGPGGLEGLTQALARTGFFHSREGYFLKRPSQSDLPVNLSVSRIHTEPEPVGLVVARDISDRKQAEEALKQVETRYNSLIASTGVMVWEIDAAGAWFRSVRHFRPSPAGRAAIGSGDASTSCSTRTIAQTAMRMHERAWQGETLPRYEFRDSNRDRGLRGLRVPACHQDSRGFHRAHPGHRPRYHRTEAEREGPRAGRVDAPGQGGSRTSQSGQERVLVEREP